MSDEASRPLLTSVRVYGSAACAGITVRPVITRARAATDARNFVALDIDLVPLLKLEQSQI
jgi:hypothetical protein